MQAVSVALAFPLVSAPMGTEEKEKGESVCVHVCVCVCVCV